MLPRTRRGRGPHREEESESKTLETVHDVTACLMRVPPGRRRAPARTRRQPLPARHRQAACASRQPRSLPSPHLATNLRDGRDAPRLARSACPCTPAPTRHARWPRRCIAWPGSGILLEPSVFRGRAGFRGERIQLLLSRFRCAGSALEAGSVIRRSGRIPLASFA